LVQKNHGVTAQALAESALKNVRILEKLNFFDIIISAKAADVLTTIEAYEIIAQKIDYPLHLGITEAGTEFSGGAKSAIGIGSLLLKGIGDTVRVSLSDDPIKEIRIALEILKSLGLRKEGVQIISCPTCARTQIDVINLSKKLEEKSADITKPLTIAVMGCVVNGLGEAEKADLGVVGVEKNALIFKKGILQRTVKKERVFDELWREVRALEKYKTK
jgi:(E)-4-hydroxy-3-methylbut-2-enyl-diphosphate synthase